MRGSIGHIGRRRQASPHVIRGLAVSPDASDLSVVSGPSIIVEVARAFDAAGVDLSALGLAWARIAPVVAIVPAFGLKALPVPVRGVFGAALAASVFPAFVGVVPIASGLPWPVLAMQEILRGIPIAIAAAVPLWAATMSGGIVDALRGSRESASFAPIEGKASPLGVPLSLLASAIFLSTGGPARVVLALSEKPIANQPVLAVAHNLVAGIGLAIAIGAPLLASAVVIEITGALIARSASPAQVHLVIAPLRALALLAIVALVLDRMAAFLAVAIQSSV
ncbi:MAG: flagellar biosynthetic protein FliR [Polyangiaceae bacterium]